MSGTIYNTYSQEKQAQIVNQLMDLFQSNQRGYGVGEFVGAKFVEDKNKWIPGRVRWEWGSVTEDHWIAHLSGQQLLGLGPIMDDNRCWYATLDVDKIGDAAGYEFDYAEEMQKIKNSKFPLIVFRTKSGGLRVALFFSSPIDAELVVPRMVRLSAILGYAGCEIFPKQTKLDVSNGDCPSWIYMPFGDTGNIFAEQGVMNELGNLLDLDDAVALIVKMRLTSDQFFDLFASEDTERKIGRVNGKKHPKGAWVPEDDDQDTINAMFHDGPPCLWTLTRHKIRDMQNNTLVNVATLFKKKYPENWEQPLSWFNVNVLQPVGNQERLNDILKRFKTQDYEYKCHDEPICSHCNAHACRRMPYGVGSGNGVDYYELGLIIVDRDPPMYWANIGEKRVYMEFTVLASQNAFRAKFIEHGFAMPPRKKNEDYDNYINRAIESAPHIKPKSLMRSDAEELEALGAWFSLNVPVWIRLGCINNDKMDIIRVREEEKRIYFKWDKLVSWMRRSGFVERQIKAMRFFVDTKCEEHKGGGHWWRYTNSIPFGMFDEEIIDRWLNPNREDDDGSQVRS